MTDRVGESVANRGRLLRDGRRLYTSPVYYSTGFWSFGQVLVGEDGRPMLMVDSLRRGSCILSRRPSAVRCNRAIHIQGEGTDARDCRRKKRASMS